MKIERKKFLAALEPLKPALTVRTVVEAQTQIWFDKKYAYAHDGGFGVRCVLETPFDFGVSGKLLLGLLNQSEAEEVNLEPKDSVLAFKAGKSSVKLTTLDKDKRPTFYPDKPKGKPQAIIKASKEFIAGLRQVLTLRPADPKRLEHHGVCLYPAADSDMDLVTTDSKAIAVMPVEQGCGSKASVLPRVFAEQIVAQCGEDEEIELYEDHFRVQATKDVALYSNVLDSSDIRDLPQDIDRLYDTKVAPPFAIPKGFNEALSRAILMAGSKEEPLVKLGTSGKVLAMAGEFHSGTFSEEFEVDRSLPERKVEVRAKPLLAVAGVDRMMVGPDALAFCGKDGFLYFLALGK